MELFQLWPKTRYLRRYMIAESEYAAQQASINFGIYKLNPNCRRITDEERENAKDYPKSLSAQSIKSLEALLKSCEVTTCVALRTYPKVHWQRIGLDEELRK